MQHGFVRRLISLVAAIALLPVQSAGAAIWVSSVSFDSSSGGIAWFADTNVAQQKSGYISYSSDGGQTFQTLPLTGSFPSAYMAISGNKMVAAPIGFSDQVRVATRANGTSPWSWTTVDGVLGETAHPEYTDAAILGSRMLVSGYQPGATKGQPALIMGSGDSGVTWAPEFYGPTYAPPSEDTTPPLSYSTLMSMDVEPGGTTAWAVGNEAVKVDNVTPVGALVVKSTDATTTWTKQSTGLSTTQLPYALSHVAAASATHVFAADEYHRFVRSTNGGTSWSKTDIPVDATRDPYIKVRGMDARGGTVVVVGAAGKIAWTTNPTVAAPTWQRFQADTSVSFTSVSMIDNNNWIAVANGGVIARTTDAGATWSLQYAGSPSVSIASPVHGFSIGSGTVVFSGATVQSAFGASTEKVELRIRRSDGKYWNGVGFGSTETWVPASTGNSWANWTYTWTDPVTGASGMAITVTARATDSLGSERTASVSSAGSESIEIAGGASLVNTSPVSVAVTYGDDVKYMRWSNGQTTSSWLPAAPTVSVPLTSGDGTKTVTLNFSTRDDMSVEATATDAVVLDATRPTLAMTSPEVGFSYRVPSVTIGGTASDAGSGISTVTVTISQNGRYWDGAAWKATQATINVPVNSGAWSYAWTPSADSSTSGRPVTVSATTSDKAGNAASVSRASTDPLDATAIALNTNSSTVAYGAAVNIAGNLTCEGVALTGTVDLVDASGNKLASANAAASTGAFSLSVKPVTKSTYRVRYAGSKTQVSALSSAVTLTPRVYLTRPAAPTSVRRGAKFTAYGYLKPRHLAGTKPIRIYREKKISSTRWKSYGYVSVPVRNYYSYSKYAGTMSLSERGTWRIRAYHAADATHAATYSTYRSITVK